MDVQARARPQHPSSCEAELGKVPAFHAAPVPKTLYHPAQLPAVPEAKPTEQQAFQLLSEARHQQVSQSPDLGQRSFEEETQSMRSLPSCCSGR